MSTDLVEIWQRSVIARNTLVGFSYTVIGARAAPGQMIRTSFLPRDATRKCGLRVSAVFAVAWCLSVCLSVTFVHSIRLSDCLSVRPSVPLSDSICLLSS